MILVNLADLIADTICYCYASILMFARFLSFYLKKQNLHTTCFSSPTKKGHSRSVTGLAS